MQLDVMPTELGIIPDIGSTSTGPSASGIKLGAQATRDPKSRKSTKPLLMTLCGIANYVLQDICGQEDMEFSFEGLQDDEDKAAITTLGVEQVQNGIALDRRGAGPPGPAAVGAAGDVRAGRVHRAGTDPVQHGAAAHREHAGRAALPGRGPTRGSAPPSSRSRTSQPSVRRGGADEAERLASAPRSPPHRENPTPGHSAAAGAIQSPTPRTGGTTSRSSVAGSRKKAVESELGALKRHLRKGRLISTWVAEHIPERVLGMIAEDIAKGVLLDVAVERAGDICLSGDRAS